MDDVAAVVVTYNSADCVGACLSSILASEGVNLRKVVVVDNASRDGTCSIVERIAGRDPRVKLLSMPRNTGFPYACNLGVAAARSRYVALVNPDAVLEPSCLARLVDVAERDDSVAVCQPKILHGSLIDSAGGLMDALGGGIHIGKYERDFGQYDAERDVLYACFACALVRRDVYLRLGGLDPRYFLYNEDLDFRLRCWLAGYVGKHSVRRVPYHAQTLLAYSRKPMSLK